MSERALPRVFLWGAQRLPDPDPSMSPEEVRDYYSQLYPELTTAAVQVTGEADGTQTLTLARPAATGGASARKGGETVQFVKNQGKRG